MLTALLLLLAGCATDGSLHGTEQGAARAIALQSDGKMILVGLTGKDGGTFSFAIARYLADGSLDPDFGTGGKVTTLFAGIPTFGRYSVGSLADAVVVQPDGKLVVSGAANIGGGLINPVQPRSGIARYRPDGSLDTEFGEKGMLTAEAGLGRALALQPDGRVVLAGQAQVGETFTFGIRRFLPDGSPDFTFGSGGKVVKVAGDN